MSDFAYLILWVDEDGYARVRVVRGYRHDAERILSMVKQMYHAPDARIVEVHEDHDDVEHIEGEWKDWLTEYAN